MTKAPSGISTKEWQEKAKQDVAGVISIILNRDCPIDVVHNQTGQKRTTTYLVRMQNLHDAKAVRSAFGKYFAGGKDGRPAALKDISVSNWTTPATKVRIAILKVLASRYRAANPEAKVQVFIYILTSAVLYPV